MRTEAVSELLPLTFLRAVGAVRVVVFDQHHVRKLEQEGFKHENNGTATSGTLH